MLTGNPCMIKVGNQIFGSPGTNDVNLTGLRRGPAGNYMCKVNNKNTKTRYEICSKLAIKTPDTSPSPDTLL